MGKLIKFLYSLMLIVLALLGAGFVAYGLFDDALVSDILSYLGDPMYRNIVLGVGIALIIFAIILLVVLIQNRNNSYELLIEDEKGQVMITKNSLESSVNNAVKKFPACELVKSRVSIKDNEKIEAKVLVDNFSDEGVDTLAERIREEVNKVLYNLTGISDIKLDLRINKKEKQAEKRNYGQY